MKTRVLRSSVSRFKEGAHEKMRSKNGQYNRAGLSKRYGGKEKKKRGKGREITQKNERAKEFKRTRGGGSIESTNEPVQRRKKRH